MININRLFWILIVSTIVTILSAIVEQSTAGVLPGIAALAFVVKTFSLLAMVVVLGIYFFFATAIVLVVVATLAIAMYHFLCGFFSKEQPSSKTGQ